MLAGIFIIVWTTVVGFILSLLPAYHLPAEALAGFHVVMANLSVWSLALPVVPALTVIGTIVIFEITVILMRLIIGMVAMVRGSGKPEI